MTDNSSSGVDLYHHFKTFVLTVILASTVHIHVSNGCV